MDANTWTAFVDRAVAEAVMPLSHTGLINPNARIRAQAEAQRAETALARTSGELRVLADKAVRGQAVAGEQIAAVYRRAADAGAVAAFWNTLAAKLHDQEQSERADRERERERAEQERRQREQIEHEEAERAARGREEAERAAALEAEPKTTEEAIAWRISLAEKLDDARARLAAVEQQAHQSPPLRENEDAVAADVRRRAQQALDARKESARQQFNYQVERLRPSAQRAAELIQQFSGTRHDLPWPTDAATEREHWRRHAPAPTPAAA